MSSLFRARSRKLVPCVVALLLVAACSPNKAKKAAESQVAKFHSQLNAAQFHDIYSQASQEFRKSPTEAEITDFLSGVHRKLGQAKDTKEQTFFVNFTTSGTMVTLTYLTEFDAGQATEQFVWKGGDEPLLYNYRIDSRAFITK